MLFDATTNVDVDGVASTLSGGRAIWDHPDRIQAGEKRALSRDHMDVPKLLSHAPCHATNSVLRKMFARPVILFAGLPLMVAHAADVLTNIASVDLLVGSDKQST